MRLRLSSRLLRPFLLAMPAAASACVAEPISASRDMQESTACALTVRFGSYAMGIDQGAAQAVEQLLRADPAVRTVERKPWGREGEFDLCVTLADTRAEGRLLDRIRALIPAKPRGPITVSTAGGRNFTVPPQ